MKLSRILLCAFSITLIMLTSSCSSEDDLPNVDLTLRYSGATDIDDVLYVVAGNDLSIDEITVTPVGGTGKATIGATAYYWNYQYVGSAIVEPFGMEFETASMLPGDYVLQINSTVYQLEKSVGIAYFTFTVRIVADESEVPGKVTPDGGETTPESDLRAGALPAR